MIINNPAIKLRACLYIVLLAKVAGIVKKLKAKFKKYNPTRRNIKKIPIPEPPLGLICPFIISFEANHYI